MPISATMLTIQVAVGLVFLWSAVAKAVRPTAFVNGLLEYNVVPERFAYPAGIIIIALELIFGLSHLGGWLFQPILASAVAFLSILMLIVVNAARHGLPTPCLCFGAKSEVVSVRTITRLSLIIAVEIALWFGVQAGYYRPQDTLTFSQFLPVSISAGLALLVASWVLVVPDLNTLRRSCIRCNDATNRHSVIR